jgi:hypothetical protein
MKKRQVAQDLPQRMGDGPAGAARERDEDAARQGRFERECGRRRRGGGRRRRHRSQRLGFLEEAHG